jgi:hypothetical protein
MQIQQIILENNNDPYAALQDVAKNQAQLRAKGVDATALLRELNIMVQKNPTKGMRTSPAAGPSDPYASGMGVR